MSVTAFNLMRRKQKALQDKTNIEVVEEIIDYKNMTNEQLKKMLDDKKIEYKPRSTKKELIELVEGA